MNNKKTAFSVLAALSLCLMLVLLGSSLKSYTQTVPVTIGRYKQAALAILTALLLFSLGFCFCPVNRRTILGTAGILFCILWFTGQMLLQNRFPEGTWKNLFSYWMPLPLVCFAAGAALWLGELTSGKVFSPVGEKWQLLLGLLLMFIALQPALNGGFNWDDAFFSVEAQAMRLREESIFARVWKEIIDYLRIGRINPFATFHFLVFYFIPDVRVYKILLVLLSLLNGYLFYRFLRLWTRDHDVSILVFLLLPLCFQFRIYHDPLNSYYGLMQVMFCELMGALICFLHWLRNGRKCSLILSLVFFTAGLMSYEMFFPFTILFLIPALENEKSFRKAIWKILPYVILALLIFVLSMILRTNITEETTYNGTTFGLDIPVILRTFSSQVGAAFPLSYRVAGEDAGIFGRSILWQDIFNTSLPVFVSSIQWQDVIGCVILAVIMLAEEKRPVFSVYKLLFGIMLWLLPGIVISLSEKYQSVLRPGLAYIPVYFSYFGMSVMLYELFAFFGTRIRPRTLRLLLCGISCAVLLINIQDSRHINGILNNIFLYPRQTGEAAVQAGILGGTDGLTVISKNPFSLWEHGWAKEPYQSEFYSLNARSEVYAVSDENYIEPYRGSDPSLFINPDNTVLISYNGNEQRGFAKCGRLRGTGFDFENYTLQNEMVSDVFLFVSGDNQKGVRINYLTRQGEWKQQALEDAWLIRETKEGALYKLQQNGTVRFDSISLIREY